MHLKGDLRRFRARSWNGRAGGQVLNLDISKKMTSSIKKLALLDAEFGLRSAELE